MTTAFIIFLWGGFACYILETYLRRITVALEGIERSLSLGRETEVK